MPSSMRRVIRNPAGCLGMKQRAEGLTSSTRGRSSQSSECGRMSDRYFSRAQPLSMSCDKVQARRYVASAAWARSAFGDSSDASAPRRRPSASRATSANAPFSPTIPSAASGAIAATTLVEGPVS